MLAALLITLREGLEAALIVGIVLGTLRKLGRSGEGRSVWAGVWAAVAVSALAGLALRRLGVAFEGRGEAIYEGVAMITAAALLTWMILWMQRQGSRIRAALEEETRQAVAGGSPRLLFGLAFVAVLREGIETALFLTAAALSAGTADTLVGGLAGLAIAVGLAWLLFVAGRRVDLGTFFRATGILLVLFAAGLVAHGVHELQEAAVLPTLVAHLWDINGILDENGVLGSLLKSLFGYNGNPSLLEALSYAGYLAVAWMAGRRVQRLALRGAASPA